MKLTYHRCGDYLLPVLTIPDESVTLGKYGRMRKTYLKEHKPILYNALLLSGKLTEHLIGVDAECRERLETLLPQMMQVEVMLPSNAPRTYADPQTLWNAVDAAETSVNAQTARSMLFALPHELTDEQNLALVRDFCQKEFVDKGMVCNFFYHDKGDGNPHVHIMLTLRAMDENGKWLPKSKNVYALDENGNRIRAPNGSWKRVKVNTADWNERRYGEIWRQDWAAAQNAALKAAGRMEHVDMRSLERQGVEDRLPQKHLGPTASALERKGVSSERGDENRKIISVNKMLASLQKTVRGIGAWLDELRKAVSRQQIIESPDDYPLSDVIAAYLDMRKDGRVPSRSSAPESTVSLSCLLYFAQSLRNSAFVGSSCSVEAK